MWFCFGFDIWNSNKFNFGRLSQDVQVRWVVLGGLKIDIYSDCCAFIKIKLVFSVWERSNLAWRSKACWIRLPSYKFYKIEKTLPNFLDSLLGLSIAQNMWLGGWSGANFDGSASTFNWSQVWGTWVPQRYVVHVDQNWRVQIWRPQRANSIDW